MRTSTKKSMTQLMMSMELKTKLMQVAHYCKEHEWCDGCIYQTDDGDCIPSKLVEYLCAFSPCDWKKDEIERVLEDDGC